MRVSTGKPMLRNYRTAALIGTVLFLAALWFFYDAFERRGRKTPRALGPFLPW